VPRSGDSGIPAMNRALVIGEAERAAIRDLKARAARSPVRLMAQPKAEDADAFREMNRSLTIALPVGYQVTFTHEIQPSGRYLHLSVSVDTPGAWPSTPAVDMILEAFGMKRLAESEASWPERDSEAVNVLQRIAP
jgi:hypothetical protein